MRELRTEIEIAASPAEVWGILTDFNNWSSWNPIVAGAAGSASSGAKLSVTMRGGGGKEANTYKPVITRIDEGQSFRWRAVMMAGFLFTNDKVCTLEETETGTRLIHIEEFRGLLVPAFWKKMETGALPMLKKMNEALKDRVEKDS